MAIPTLGEFAGASADGVAADHASQQAFLHREPKTISRSMAQALHFGDRTVMFHRGKIVFDVDGEQRAAMTVADLLYLFRRDQGEELTDDALSYLVDPGYARGGPRAWPWHRWTSGAFHQTPNIRAIVRRYAAEIGSCCRWRPPSTTISPPAITLSIRRLPPTNKNESSQCPESPVRSG
jgi:hypothetical protein